MSRIRSIKPEFFLHEGVASCREISRLAWIGLWTLADRDGRLHDRPMRIKAQLFPYQDVDMDKVLDELQDHDLVLRYEVDGERYVAIPGFAKHQKPHPKETAGCIPPPPSRENKRLAVESSGEPGKAGASRVVNGSGSGSGSGSGDLAGSADACPPEPAEEDPVVVSLPCVGDGPQKHDVTASQVAEWAKAFPGVDVANEMRMAKVWLDANPTRRKTAKGAPRFCVSWLGRAQDRPASPASRPSNVLTREDNAKVGQLTGIIERPFG